jgi:hypothetical protein
MNGISNKLPAVNNLKVSYEIKKADVNVFGPCDLNYETIPKESAGDIWFHRTGAVVVAFLCYQQTAQQINAVVPQSSEKLCSFSKWVSVNEKLNSLQLVGRIQSSQSEASNTKYADIIELETIFDGLAKNWIEETGGYSLTMRRYAHSSYQSILALEPKKDVISLILLELQRRPDRWFEALKALTKTNPAQNAKTFDETVRCWIEWGKRENYIS